MKNSETSGLLSFFVSEIYIHRDEVEEISNYVDFRSDIPACPMLFTYRGNFVKFKGRNCCVP